MVYKQFSGEMLHSFSEMKYFGAFFIVFYLLKTTDWVSGNSPVVTKWMSQKMDNFNSKNNETWYMRYMVNEMYFNDGGPMFVLIGGEFGISAGWIEWGLLVDMAAEHGGILFQPEHRFYGQSTVGTTLSLNTLEFLTSRQALEDLANFINTQRSSDPRLANSKVIIAGCSYAGSLAVWFNHLYPKLMHGTWAISAPLEAKVEFPEFLEITGRAMKELGSAQCYDRIQNGIAELEKMFYDSRGSEATELLNLCYYFDHTNEKDIWILFRQMQYMFSELVAYHKLPKKDIAKVCDALMASPDDLSAIVSYFHKHYPGTDCKGVNYLGSVFYDSKTAYGNSMDRQWRYQVCNEFGWFFGTTSSQQPFGKSSPIALDFSQCMDIFGPEFTEDRIRKRVAETNKVYGGMKPKVKNILMTYGGLDPWSALGPDESDICSVVPFYSHCVHLDSMNRHSDTTEMIASKQRLMTKVREWLA